MLSFHGLILARTNNHARSRRTSYIGHSFVMKTIQILPIPSMRNKNSKTIVLLHQKQQQHHQQKGFRNGLSARCLSIVGSNRQQQPQRLSTLLLGSNVHYDYRKLRQNDNNLINNWAIRTHGGVSCRCRFVSSSSLCMQPTSVIEVEVEDEDFKTINNYKDTKTLQTQLVDEVVDGDVDKSSCRRLFEVTAKFAPAGDQPEAIRILTNQLQSGNRYSILKGITGTGKTLVMSHVIANVNKPCLVLCHNKTLAAQLARELRSFLKNSAVEFFVSYYNHYRPESFQETSGRYTAKKSSINSEIDALRHRATRSLLTREDVVVVASVSCIYGLGLPRDYLDASIDLSTNDIVKWSDIINQIQNMRYEVSMNDEEFTRGQFQVRVTSRNDQNNNSNNTTSVTNNEDRTIVLWPPHEKFPMQIKLSFIENYNNDNGTDSDENNKELSSVEDRFYRITSIREGRQNGLDMVSSTCIFPAKHHVVPEERLENACLAIEDELEDRLQQLRVEGKIDEAERLQTRVMNDVYMMRETGFCSGGENYSRHLAGRLPLQPPDTLMDYFSIGKNGQPRDWLLIVDESHVTLPQLSAMYEGDQARKRILVKHGYRLPSALDNRPLKGSEFWDRVHQAVFVSATPSHRELSLTSTEPVEMVIRPTYVCDPEIFVRPKKGQLQDLLNEVRKRIASSSGDGTRTLVTTITKRDAEDLATFMKENDVKSTFIHSGLSTLERSNALKALQNGDIDCLVGVNLLREGLDLPQVSLVAILNADSEGFLRCETSLLQTVGRAARNTAGIAILYADRVTESMRKCIEATNTRRTKQLEYNLNNGHIMKSTSGSSVLSIFDLLKDQIEAEQTFEAVNPKRKNGIQTTSVTLPLIDIESGGSTKRSTEVDTDHIPNDPGVYMWKDSDNNILYIGKAIRLRSRVKSYLSPKATHSRRIQVMIQKATSVDFIITPSERDALLLESNLIKHHQPNFNVLLKDDDHYPYMCASIGDSIPRLFIVPQKHEPTMATTKYRYYGPYTSLKEVNEILDGVEKKYSLRSLAFLVRHGSESKEKYNEVFDSMIDDVFGVSSSSFGEDLIKLRMQYEEAGLLFDSKFNRCRDVVALGHAANDAGKTENTFLVHLIQLRDGVVAGSYSYRCQVPVGILSDEDYADAIDTVLTMRHYPSAPTHNSHFSWFPDEILLPFPSLDSKQFKLSIRQARSNIDTTSQVRKPIVVATIATTKGPKRESSIRALDFASKNANQIATTAISSSSMLNNGVTSLSDGTAAKQLASLLSMEFAPSRIECFDISHTQGLFPVASRVVFINGKPAPHLYRMFNIRPDDGGDDYASMAEVLERRFVRLHKIKTQRNGGQMSPSDEPWSRPDLVVIDGGKGQLSAAMKGIEKASIRSGLFVDDGDIANGEDNSSIQLIENDIPICALAKNKEEVYVPGKDSPVNDDMDSSSPALLLLRSLRDESHRFALNAHRRRRSIRKTE